MARWGAFVGALLSAASVLLIACDPQRGAGEAVASAPTAARSATGEYISWREHRIDDEDLGGVALRGGDGLEVADLDGDGHLDIVSVHEDSHHIRLAFGSRDPDAWVRVTLAEGREVADVEDVPIGDMNGDGNPDVIAACENAHLIYFQNPGADARSTRWERVIPNATVGRGSFIRVFVADLTGDGRLEVVVANKGTHEILDSEGAVIGSEERERSEISWFDVPANPLDGAEWSEHVLARVKVPINSPPIDLDRDGDVDVLGGSRGESRVMWFENEGVAPAFSIHAIEIAGRTVPHQAGELRLSGMNVGFADLNGDGRTDLVLTETPTSVVWLEQSAVPTESWRLHSIGSTSPDMLVGVAMADIDSDGDSDVMTGGYSLGPRLADGGDVTRDDPVGRLAWFENPGASERRPWIRHDISRRKRGMFDGFVPLDLDRDGDVDLLSTRGNSGRLDGVFWLEQVRTEKPSASFAPSRRTDSEQLPLPSTGP